MSKNIYQKLLSVSKEISSLKKNKLNQHFRNTYCDINDILSVIKPLLNDQGLLLLQPIDEGKVITQIMDCETNEKIQFAMVLDETLTNVQQIGSRITYLRRYSLQSLLALQVEDDDGNEASNISQSNFDVKVKSYPREEEKVNSLASEKQMSYLNNITDNKFLGKKLNRQEASELISKYRSEK